MELLAYGAECRREAFEEAAKHMEADLNSDAYEYMIEQVRALADTDKQGETK